MLSRRLLRVKVIKALYAYLYSDGTALKAASKNLAVSIDKTYELYFQMLSLLPAVARYAEQRQETARQKQLPTYEDLNPNRKFVENAVVRRLAEDDGINSFVESHRLGWSQYPETIRSLYAHLAESDFFKAYMAREERSWRDDMQLVESFYVNELEDNEELESVLEDMSIMWSDDLGFALMMVVRTLQSMRAGHAKVKLLPRFKSDDDPVFARELFERAALQYADNERYIERFTANWDVERIAMMDKIIMAAAMTEMMTFESIPVKVTLDEYIEIAKYYSTPGSSTFINGVMDKISESLTAEGRIVKSGRGLI